MPKDRSRSPLSRRRRSRSRSRSRERYRDRYDRDPDRRRRERETRKDERHRRDYTPERRKERRHRDTSDERRGKNSKVVKTWGDNRPRTPDQTDKVPNDTSSEDKETKVPQTEEELEMMKSLGFFNFDSTKGKHVKGNNVYVANIQKKRKYRQYMNRRGGFNRKLDPIT